MLISILILCSIIVSLGLLKLCNLNNEAIEAVYTLYDDCKNRVELLEEQIIKMEKEFTPVSEFGNLVDNVVEIERKIK